MTAAAMVKAENVHKSFGHVKVLKAIWRSLPRTCFACSDRPGPASRPSCGVSTFWNIDGGQLYVDERLVGYRQHGDKLYELRERKSPRIGMTSAWCSSGSTCSRT